MCLGFGGGGGGDGFPGGSEAMAAAALGEFGTDVGDLAEAAIAGDTAAGMSISGIAGHGGTASMGTADPGLGPIPAGKSWGESNTLAEHLGKHRSWGESVAKGVLQAATMVAPVPLVGTLAARSGITNAAWTGDPEAIQAAGTIPGNTEMGGPGDLAQTIMAARQQTAAPVASPSPISGAGVVPESFGPSPAIAPIPELQPVQLPEIVPSTVAQERPTAPARNFVEALSNARRKARLQGRTIRR